MRKQSRNLTKPGFSRWNLALGVLILFSALLFFAGAMVLVQRLFCPFQVNQGEAINVEFALRLLRGEALYPDPSQGPYLYAAYPPLFPLLQAFFIKIFHSLWLPGRLIAFTGYLGCALSLGLWGWRHWDKQATFALLFLFLLSPTWATWGSMVRVDTFMIFLEFLAFLLLAQTAQLGGKKDSRAGVLFLAGGVTALAILLKQNGVLLVLAYALYCWLGKKWRNFFFFSAATLLPVALVSTILQWATSGNYLKYTLLWLPFGFQPGLLAHYLAASFLPECGWLVGGVFLTWWIPKTSLLSKCQLFFSLLWVLGLGREAGAENYYLEFFLYGLYFLGEGWASRSVPGVVKELFYRKPVLTGLLAIGFVFLNLKVWPQAPSLEEREMKASVLEVYRGPGEELALDLDLPLMAGKRLWIQPLEYTRMVEKGVWSAEPLLSDIRSKKFSTIELYDIPRQYLLPLSVAEEIQRNYHPEIKKYGRIWLAPNG